MAKKVNKKAAKVAKKVTPKKVVKKAASKKPAKKVVKKVAPKKAATKKVAPKKVAKKVAPKKAVKNAKPVKSNSSNKSAKKVTSAPKKVAPVKEKKLKGKPIDAVAKKGKSSAKKTNKGKKKGKSSADDDEEVDVKDDYESEEEEDFDGELEDAGIDDAGDAPVDDDDDDEDEVPIRRGRGRRKKNEGKSSSGSKEAYIRNRPIQVDLSKPLIKKNSENEPTPFVNTKDNRTRYSDKELAEFKELILHKLKEAQDDYDLLKQTLSNEDNHGTDDTSPTFKLLEDGSDVMSKEETAQLAARQEKYIVNLKNALVRIENKSYGVCRVSGKLIPKERLRSVPHATLGIDAKLNQDK